MYIFTELLSEEHCLKWQWINSIHSSLILIWIAKSNCSQKSWILNSSTWFQNLKLLLASSRRGFRSKWRLTYWRCQPSIALSVDIRQDRKPTHYEISSKIQGSRSKIVIGFCQLLLMILLVSRPTVPNSTTKLILCQSV